MFANFSALINMTWLVAYAVIAFDVSAERVNVIGVFYGGQDYETTLNPPDSDSDITQ